MGHKRVETYITVFGVDRESVGGLTEELENLRAEV